MCRVVFEILDTGVSIVIEEVYLQLRKTQIIGQSLKELIRLSLQNIAAFQYEFFDGGIGVDDVEEFALTDGGEFGVVGVVDNFVVEVAGGVDAVLEALG